MQSTAADLIVVRALGGNRQLHASNAFGSARHLHFQWELSFFGFAGVRFRSSQAKTAQREAAVDDLNDLTERAELLRARIAEFLRKFGDLTPELRELQEILAQIQEHLKALAELEQDEKEEG